VPNGRKIVEWQFPCNLKFGTFNCKVRPEKWSILEIWAHPWLPPLAVDLNFKKDELLESFDLPMERASTATYGGLLHPYNKKQYKSHKDLNMCVRAHCMEPTLPWDKNQNWYVPCFTNKSLNEIMFREKT